MRVQAIKLHSIALPLVEPLLTSFGGEVLKTAILVEIRLTDGTVGWGEIAVAEEPGYGPETMDTARIILEAHILPRLDGIHVDHPSEVPSLLSGIRGHRHTKAGVEAAFWDACAKSNHLRLIDLFASSLEKSVTTRDSALVGVSIGIQPSVEDTLQIIHRRLEQGYGRIKLKIRPGWDVELIRGVREALPEITLMADANSAYTIADGPHLKELDEFNLLMIEQPLEHDDLYQHGMLQREIRTPICLDESIKSLGDLQLALSIEAIDILNLKPARVGGFSESLHILQLCVERELPLWIGGLLETGVGRAANLAFAALPGITLPCDISATDRYFSQDVTEPAFFLNPDSTITIPDGFGVGVEVIPDRLSEAAARWQQRSANR
jgi:O-succinylbenzoate synthase